MDRIKKRYKIFIAINKGVHLLEGVFGMLQSVLSARQFLYLSSVLVAISSGLAVIVLKTFAHKVFEFTTYVNALIKLPYINSILPVAGILLTVLVVRKFLGGKIEKGTSQVMIAVARHSGFMPKKQMYAQIVTSSLTVGMGGSAGLESPIAITGAAFGSNYAKSFHLNYKQRTLLLACGVAAGIATAFNAPIAGVLFAIEVVLADMSVSAFIPLIISSATGALMANVFMQENILLHFREELTFDFFNTPYYILLGVLAGFISVYHARLFRKTEHMIGSYASGVYKRALTGAAMLAVLIFIFPSLFGEGYESIKHLSLNQAEHILDNSLAAPLQSNPWIVLVFVAVTMLVKAVATGLTLGSGGNGGNFAPSLFVGSYLGFIVAKLVALTGLKDLPVNNFTVVGMAAVLSGLFHAPLTAVFLIAEITGGYGLIVPLMIVASISYAISRRYDTYSMDISAIADKGLVFTSDKDRNILNKINLWMICKKDVEILSPEASWEEARQVFATTAQEFIPVVTAQHKITGIIRFDTIRPYLLHPESIQSLPFSSMITEAPSASLYDHADKVMKMMDEQHISYILLTKNNEYAGYVTKASLLEAYRYNLKNLRIE